MKNISIKIILFIVNVFLTYTSLRAEFTYFLDPGYSGIPGEYLNSLGTSVRGLAMGKAYTGETKQSTAGYWNPAGLTGLERTELFVNTQYLPVGTMVNTLGVAVPFLTKHSLSLTRLSLDLTDVQKTSSLGNVEGTFSYNDTVYFFTYAYMVNERLSIGTNLKLVFQYLDINAAQGYGIDAGVIYILHPLLTIGLKIQNLIPPVLKLKSEQEPYPLGLRLGVSGKFLNSRMLVTGDINLPMLFPDTDMFREGKTSFPVYWHLGTEFTVIKELYFRAGVDYKELSFGLGLAIKGIVLDYAILWHPITVTHRVGVAYRFGLSTADELELKQARKLLEIQRVYDRAQAAFNIANYEQTRKEITVLFSLDPDHYKGQMLLKEVETIEQQRLGERLYDAAFNDLFTGKEIEGRKKLAQAVRLLPEKAKQLEPEFYNSALSRQNAGDFTGARQELIKVLYLNPDNLTAREMLKRIEEILQLIPE